MNDYHINVFYSDDDGGYIADVPDLEICSAFGETPEQAVAEVLRAKEAYLVANQTGLPASWDSCAGCGRGASIGGCPLGSRNWIATTGKPAHLKEMSYRSRHDIAGSGKA